MSGPVDPVVVDGSRLAAHPVVVARPDPPDRRDSWLRVEPEYVMTLPPAGQDGHGRTAFVRRQPVRIVDGRFEGGYTDLFELICPCAARILDCVADLRSHLRPGGGDGWLAGCRSRSST